ncbi:MAG TPA: hypothetical protein VF250_09100 [Conexibacter sp.]
MRGGLTTFVAGCALALFMVGCGGGESAPGTVAERPAPTTTAPARRAPQERGLMQSDWVHRLAPNPWHKPTDETIGRHPGFQLDHVVVRELRKGTGPGVRPHDIVLIDYIEGDYRRGRIYNAAWGKPPNGTAGVILQPAERWRGLVIGMTGMRKGARRQILVPPRLAGTQPEHAEYHIVVLWDVVLRKILARGCTNDGVYCRSVATS